MVDVVRILFPTDFSESSAEAGKYAFTLADRLGAELHALHVIEAIAPTVTEAMGRVMTEPMGNYLEQARDGAEHALAAALPSDLAGGKKVTRVVRTGAALGTILDYAKENAIDLIAMGTHGRSGMPHFLVGSVAERVVRHASCPVLTVPPQR